MNEIRPMVSDNEVLELLERNLESLRQFGVRRLSLFGSVARGEESGSSDVDLLVELNHKSFDAYMDLKFYLEDLLGRPVDLVLSDALKPRLRDAIQGELIYVSGL